MKTNTPAETSDGKIPVYLFLVLLALTVGCNAPSAEETSEDAAARKGTPRKTVSPAATNQTGKNDTPEFTGEVRAEEQTGRQTGRGKEGPGKKTDAAALEALKKTGATIDTDAEGRVIEITFRRKKLTPAIWAVFRKFPDVEILDLDGSGVSDADLAHLKAFRHLKVLSLQENPITDEGLKHLSGLRTLENLALTKTRITGKGLKHIAGLTNLRTLNLSHCKIGDEGLVHLSGMKEMETLALQNAGVTGPGLKYVGQLKNMITLTLSDSQIKGDAMLHLKGLSKLRIIHLYDCKVSQSSLDKLEAEIPTLAIFR